MNNGNAVNFLYSAAVDKYIYLVQGELVNSIVSLYEYKDSRQRGHKLETNGKARQNAIADAWVDYIYKYDA